MKADCLLGAREISMRAALRWFICVTKSSRGLQLETEFDVIIIGSGAGGGTLTYALARGGARVLLVERGDFVPQEEQNRYPDGCMGNRYNPIELREFADGSRASRKMFYHVGGQTKFYGAALLRLRELDFKQIRFPGGTSPAWPILYDDLEPYYSQAEQLYRVHGSVNEDPSEPPHSAPYAFPPLPHEPWIQSMINGLREQGLHPASLPRAVDFGPGRRCFFCTTCDGYACPSHGKMDAETACIRPALVTGNVKLLPRSYCRRLITDKSGSRVAFAEIERDGKTLQFGATRFVLSCGSINSPALLFRSSCPAHPNGLANSSGMLGRNLLCHNVSLMIAGRVAKRLPPMHQKTFHINDYYAPSHFREYPLGTIQPAGQLRLGALHARLALTRCVPFFLMAEDLPNPNNRVTVTPDGTIRIEYRANNTRPLGELRTAAKDVFRRAGYRVYCTKTPREGTLMKPSGDGHCVGTLRFGNDPATSVLDPFCKTHDIDNLYVVDGSFLPSAGAVNPALTIIAQALRTADRILCSDLRHSAKSILQN
jgi:choline dehydrogenase-like flavoprotein